MTDVATQTATDQRKAAALDQLVELADRGCDVTIRREDLSYHVDADYGATDPAEGGGDDLQAAIAEAAEHLGACEDAFADGKPPPVSPKFDLAKTLAEWVRLPRGQWSARKWRRSATELPRVRVALEWQSCDGEETRTVVKTADTLAEAVRRIEEARRG